MKMIMKKEKLPYLNLDKATSLYLPLEPIEARAHHRFAFRLANGDEEWMLARLCVVKTDITGEKLRHCVVLRPENAEVSRIFVANHLWYDLGRRKLDCFMTPNEAGKFNWDLFELSFKDIKHQNNLSRYWCISEKERTTLLEFDANGWGKIVGHISPTENTIHKSDVENFIYRKLRRGETCLTLETEFLLRKDKHFCRRIRSLWNDENSQINYAFYWMSLSNAERDTIAFECKNGNWKILTEIAKLVLQVRLSHLKKLTESVFNWDFVDYGHISVRGTSQLHHDNALFLWRFALTRAFGTTNIGVEGVKCNSCAVPLWSYILDADQKKRTYIEVLLPSKHELIEATLKLDEWAKANFTEENARILMNSFSYCSDEDKQKFYESLNANDSL